MRQIPPIPPQIRARLWPHSVEDHPERLRQVTTIFKTLSDPTRLRILAALFPGERCVNELSRRLDMSESAMSHQLRVLRSAGLVKPRRAGRAIFYSLDDAHVMSLIQEALSHVRHGKR